MAQILVIDDRIDIRVSLRLLLEDNGYHVVEAENPQHGQRILAEHTIDLLLLDMNYSQDTTSGAEGLAFLRWLNEQSLQLPCIVLTAWSNTELVVQAMQLGASDFIEKPWQNKQLLHVIKQQLALQALQGQNASLKQQLLEHAGQQTGYQWRSPCMLQFLTQLSKVAKTEVNILLTGDNGTGKSELAKLIHQQSTRAEQALVSVNMGAITETLFETEMFGHTKGAFTDAKTQRIGRFELAQHGSLFLDEIANMPLTQQMKLLRVLETGEFEPVGSSDTKHCDVRIISATNGNIAQQIEQGLFRQDLYYRLNTLEFHVPALAQRTLDIVPLAQYFVALFQRKYHTQASSISAAAEQALLAYHWPGNIRELSHLIERAVLLSQSRDISVADLHLGGVAAKAAVASTGTTELPMMTLAQAELMLIKQALAKTEQHVPKAAKLLGLTKSSLYRRLEKYALV